MKPWREMTEREIEDLKKRQCMKCAYFTRISAGAVGGTCDFIGIEKHSRGCLPTECVEKGVFKKRTRKRRKRIKLYWNES